MSQHVKRILLATFAVFVLTGNNSLAFDLPDFTELVEKNSDAVVNISTTQKPKNVRSGLPPNMQQLPENGPYNDLFKHFFGAPGQRRPQRESHSLGSGFIISEDGYLLTNHHVVRDADEIIVRFQDRRELKATLIGSDERTDVALLKVEAKGLPVVKFGSSKQLKVGEWVFAIGSPFGFDSTVTAGIVSAKGRSLPQENYVPFIQTDVAINPGNSGGPLFNMDGEVVGINSQIYSRSGGFMGLSFAIPIDVALNVSNQLKKSGHVIRGWLGVRIQDVTRELAESFDMDKPHGALVSQVITDSPAEKAGLQIGDVIIEFNGDKVNRSSSLPPLVGSASISDKARVKIIRNKKIKVINVTLENLPEDEQAKAIQTGKLKDKPNNMLGMAVINLTAEMRKKMDIKKFGVLVKLVEKGSASKAGIRAGDVIMQFDGVDVKGVKHLVKLASKIKKSKFVSVLISRQGNPIFLALKK
ncbi:MAG: serine peptidase [Piscirickettsiaceae bacterium]|nr:MAG: serine peptidase [Piscirickettsiaceae bacterium]PCI72194.1 MAG: serine peptidase [Piscirickettsiaceae bacterium]